MKNKLFTKQTKFFVVIAITIVFLFLPAILKIDGGVALALNTGLEDTAESAGLSTNNTVAGIIGQIIYAILGFLGVVFIILLIYGGFVRMTAQGDPGKIKSSTGIITSAIVGIIIILASYAITAFVMSNVGASIGTSGGTNDYANDGNYIQSGSCVKTIVSDGYSNVDCFDNETVDSCIQKCQGLTGGDINCTWSQETCTQLGH